MFARSLLVLLMLSRSGIAAEPSPWMTDYEEAKKVAKRTGKPLFVVFRCDH